MHAEKLGLSEEDISQIVQEPFELEIVLMFVDAKKAFDCVDIFFHSLQFWDIGNFLKKQQKETTMSLCTG